MRGCLFGKHLFYSILTGDTVGHINAHSGTDAWGDAEAREYFESVGTSVSGFGSDLPSLSHETHRGRFLCCPFATARLLRVVPSLRLTADLSHWVR